MKKIFTLALAALMTCAGATAFAQEGPTPQVQATASQTSAQQQAATSSAANQGNAQSIAFSTPADTQAAINYAGSYTIKNVPSVSGPPLTTSNDTCMGSTSGGVNGPGFGVSIGSTWSDTNCKMLKNSREMWNMGMKAASLALLCTDPSNKAAIELTGTVCPQSMTADQRTKVYGPMARAPGQEQVVAVQAVTNPVVRSTDPVVAYTQAGGNDPIVLQHMRAGGYADK